MLKDDPRTRHIPVHIMSVEEVDPTAFRKGAIGFLHKPPDEEQLDEAFRRIAEASRRSVKDVLVVEDDAAMQRSIAELVGDRDVNIDTASTGAEARQAAAGKRYDCMILDLGLADMDGKELLGALEADLGGALPPVIVYTGRDVSRSEELELRRFSDSIIIKDVRSEERLVDEVSLFLHSVVEEMPAGKRRIIVDLHDVDRLFRDKKVLVVDDDMRTVFALSRVLSAKGVRTLKAEDGAKALAVLEREPDVDLVLMDIMMPVMDGYETMRRIRDQSRFVDLPIIALTAKAMKGDEELCIAAGASDYMPKPVDEQRLFSMMRVWLYR
jgi:CheY-like chemotaxis protein